MKFGKEGTGRKRRKEYVEYARERRKHGSIFGRGVVKWGVEKGRVGRK